MSCISATRILHFSPPFTQQMQSACSPSDLLRYLISKQYGPKSDCSLRSSLIRVHSAGYHDKKSLKCTWIYAADVISRHSLYKKYLQERSKTWKSWCLCLATSKCCHALMQNIIFHFLSTCVFWVFVYFSRIQVYQTVCILEKCTKNSENTCCLIKRVLLNTINIQFESENIKSYIYIYISFTPSYLEIYM